MLLDRCQHLAAEARRAGATDFVCTGSTVHRHETTRTEQGRRAVASQQEQFVLTLWNDGVPVQLRVPSSEVERCEATIRAALRLQQACDSLRRRTASVSTPRRWQGDRSQDEAPIGLPPLPAPVLDVDALDATMDRVARWDRIAKFQLRSHLTARADVLIDRDGAVATQRQASQSLSLSLLAHGPQGLLSRTKDWHWDAEQRWDVVPPAQLVGEEAERAANDLYDALLSAPPSSAARMVVLTGRAAAPFVAAPGSHAYEDRIAVREDAPALGALLSIPPWRPDGTHGFQSADEPDDPSRVRCVRVAPQDHTTRNLLGRVAVGYLVDGAAAWEWLPDGRVAVGFDAAWYVENGEVLHAVRDAAMVMSAEAFWTAIRAVGDEDTTARVVLRPESKGAVLVDAPAVLLDPATLENLWVQTASGASR